MKRFMSIALSTVLLAGTLAACSPKDEKASSSTKNGKDSKITISWFDGTWENPVPEPGNDAVKKVNEKFNVDFKPQYIPFDLYDDKLTVKMASGDIPDVIGTEGADTNYIKWSKQGAFLPLNDYVDKYETFKDIPQSVWDAVSVDGKKYGIPLYFPSKGGKKPVIRQDWLDKLGLKMPTNFEELKEVAVAFATQDPDGNGKNDTVGLGLAKGLVYDPSFGAYWGNSWYHENKDGQLIPGQISEGSKEKVTYINEMFKAGAIDKDWAIKPYNDVFKDFNAGKVGIWYEQPGNDKGSQPNNLDLATLRKNAPDAKIAAIPPFVAPDKSQGYVAGSGYYRIWMLSSKLKNDPKKVEKILEMMDYMAKYVPADQQTPHNEYFDWIMGGNGKGYTIVDGAPQLTEEYSKNAPISLFNQKQGGWDKDNQAMKDYVTQSKAPEAKEFNTLMGDMLSEADFFVSPVGRIHSDVYNDKNAALTEFATNELTKMVVGQRPISDWDKYVDEYLAKGGKDVIADVNKLIKESKIKGEWVKAK
ncbi:family 1 extracellular solute-binding protein [Neobacillus bataviensis LMG 21833]|uniref:Family 1 extracellular solute-binding protein n=1 Tax=Neobacillus bataviensis LMG 21833 TaxID=1117379 RepID=K6DAZ2_9BACI|nr:extracellular solute-binding protein [Neobacillus bataviensis]EKN65243.1 family 1 extracellular solute-binding protein [Neobacillus bataviensis LMG 21833]